MGVPLCCGEIRCGTLVESCGDVGIAGKELERGRCGVGIGRAHVGIEFVLAFGQLAKCLLQSGGAGRPAHTQVVSLCAVGKGGNLSEVVVRVAVSGDKQLGHAGTADSPAGGRCQSVATETVGGVVHCAESADVISLEGCILHIVSSNIGLCRHAGWKSQRGQ